MKRYFVVVVVLAALSPVLSPRPGTPPTGLPLGPYLVPGSVGFVGSLSLRMPMPKPWADILRNHVSSILRNRWAHDLTPRDLDHGHLLMKPGWECTSPCELDEVMAGVAAIMYHTAERAGRWKNEGERGVPVDRRTTRSVIGWPDGRVQPAIELVSSFRERLTAYDSNGTVFDNDLPTLRPDLFMQHPLYPIRVVGSDADITCELSNQFDILQDDNGRFALPDGREYDALLVCIALSGTLG